MKKMGIPQRLDLRRDAPAPPLEAAGLEDVVGEGVGVLLEQVREEGRLPLRELADAARADDQGGKRIFVAEDVLGPSPD